MNTETRFKEIVNSFIRFINSLKDEEKPTYIRGFINVLKDMERIKK